MKSLFARFNRENTIKMREYESYEAALNDSDSYEDPRLVEIVKEKTRRYRDSLATNPRPEIETRQMVQNMFVLSHVEPLRPLNVLEIGGACGACYYETKSLVPNRVGHWSITETPAMAAAGTSLSDDPRLSFHSDLQSAAEQLESRDLAIAQGVLQYATLGMLEALFDLHFSYVYVTRTVVANVNTRIFTKQDTDLAAHGPGTLPNTPAGKSSQPLILVSADSLFSAIPVSYETLFTFIESAESVLAIDNRRVTVRDVGFLARLQPQ